MRRRPGTQVCTTTGVRRPLSGLCDGVGRVARRRRFGRACRIVGLVLGLNACSTTPEPATGPVVAGEVAGLPIAGRVDTAVARYYLEDYPGLHPAGWGIELAGLEGALAHGEHGAATFAGIAATYDSTDLAALLFVHHVRSQPPSRAFAACMAAVRDGESAAAGVSKAALTAVRRRFRVVLAPGWLYRDQAVTEADFASTRAALRRTGVDHELISTAQDGSVESNARQIAERLRELADSDRKLVVVSASKSGAEVHYALGELLEPEVTDAISAWINVGGLLRGTPLADRWSGFPRNLIAWPYMAWQGWDWASLRSLRTAISERRYRASQMPDDLLVVNYIGVPLASQLTHGAGQRYQWLARYGPNDGATLLADARVEGGVTVVEPGVDHYFHRVPIGTTTLAMAAAVQRYLEDAGCQ